MKILRWISNTAIAELARATALLVVERRARVAMTAQLRAISERLMLAEELLEKRSVALEEIGDRLRDADAEKDQIRTEHAVYLESSLTTHAQTIAWHVEAGEAVAQRLAIAQSFLDAIREVCQVSADVNLPAHVRLLAESKRAEGIRESTRVQLENQIRDALDVARVRNHMTLTSLARIVAEELRSQRSERRTLETDRDGLRDQVSRLLDARGQIGPVV